MATSSKRLTDSAVWNVGAIPCPACSCRRTGVVCETVSHVYLSCDSCHHVWSRERPRTSPAFRITRWSGARAIVRNGAAA